jgi:hypothetical protein
MLAQMVYDITKSPLASLHQISFSDWSHFGNSTHNLPPNSSRHDPAALRSHINPTFCVSRSRIGHSAVAQHAVDTIEFYNRMYSFKVQVGRILSSGSLATDFEISNLFTA